MIYIIPVKINIYTEALFLSLYRGIGREMCLMKYLALTLENTYSSILLSDKG